MEAIYRLYVGDEPDVGTCSRWSLSGEIEVMIAHSLMSCL